MPLLPVEQSSTGCFERGTARVAGQTREWKAQITEPTPDQRIAWRAVEGADNAGVVTFHKVDDRQTRIMLQLDVKPDGVLEKAGDAVGLLERSVKQDLEHFKELVKSSEGESGAWRGEVQQEPTD